MNGIPLLESFGVSIVTDTTPDPPSGITTCTLSSSSTETELATRFPNRTVVSCDGNTNPKPFTIILVPTGAFVELNE